MSLLRRRELRDVAAAPAVVIRSTVRNATTKIRKNRNFSRLSDLFSITMVRIKEIYIETVL